MEHIGQTRALIDAGLCGGVVVEMADYLVVECLMVLPLGLREPLGRGSQAGAQGGYNPGAQNANPGTSTKGDGNDVTDVPFEEVK